MSTLLCCLQNIAFCAQKKAIQPDAWYSPYLTRAASLEIGGWWMQYADKETTRLNLAEIMSKYLSYLEKENLIARKSPGMDIRFSDVPLNAPFYSDVRKVVYQYKIMECTESKDFMGEIKVTINQFAVVLARAIAMDPDLPMNQAEAVKFVKRKAMDNFSDRAFKENRPVKRYEVMAALVKTAEYLKQQRVLAVKKKEKEPATAAKLKNEVSLGGMMGHLYEQSSSSNSNYTYGGELAYSNRLVEVVGSGISYNARYLIPNPGAIRDEETTENKLDAMVNYKNPLLSDLAGGSLFSALGFRGILLRNDLSNNTFLGLRGGLEYLRDFSDKLGGKVTAGLAGKVVGDAGPSILGALSSAMDYGAEISYSLSPDSTVSLDYEGDALFFNQSYARYFNSLVLKSGWKL
ncbi:hypothetical protein A2276_07050 [candidate division WOR-1 bacterium RIFOXYA12_FULL_43_27]|uniref:SLH domain-containing protein n=1 Tax=candidate division WOR-1 bacterium RIFOXYC2_FULL_46_14 TaxID=1802587 RepID=A0A1F4U350_UNCSA|nr:MAG: hypothetical protein A2276_07050 [candidate division WOR-1 bacterium RIFOXYA12_FULL_43_27]OGC18843.1 MAG: hypothetical protein A2292_07905 [candidate division WOR-1 bacterium RIFOXYB2_FULL_46_45]OGC28984.1 MAG: hypothetical protein A2232_02970 [candidate division WOR-1 bacterium RIFOXYA2_FULL_46_56]OGC39366.1 MAG: hypothetical protein A2438_06585 [candidate division WOR-1 bacterium RIFOXYC2_FULL_46_14]